MSEKVIGVGTALFIVKNKKVLVGKRKNSHAAGLYSIPGGHLNWGEEWDVGVLREKDEECGEDFHVKMKDLGDGRSDVFITNDVMPQYDKHYVTIFMVADWVSGEPVNMEPEKCEGWIWVDYDTLIECIKYNYCSNWMPLDLIVANRHRIGI